MTSGLSRRPVRSARILAQEAGGSTVLLSLDDGAYFSLNEVGGVIWELCDGNHTIGEVATVISNRYDAPEDQVFADVVALVADLMSEQLLVDAS